MRSTAKIQIFVVFALRALGGLPQLLPFVRLAVLFVICARLGLVTRPEVYATLCLSRRVRFKCRWRQERAYRHSRW